MKKSETKFRVKIFQILYILDINSGLISLTKKSTRLSGSCFRSRDRGRCVSARFRKSGASWRKEKPKTPSEAEQHVLLRCSFRRQFHAARSVRADNGGYDRHYSRGVQRDRLRVWCDWRGQDPHDVGHAGRSWRHLSNSNGAFR
jgi:hypothetical protein